MNRWIKNSLLALLFACCSLAVWNASLIGYGIEQGWGQLNIVFRARPISAVLRDTLFSDTLKYKLRMVERVKKFAEDTLGLDAGQNYTTVFDQRGKEIMWVVTACKPFEFTAKKWNFPILGSVPYKGFFHREHAVDELKTLQKEGWDTNLSNPSGWSTLGIFDEPILSGMLRRSEGDLANLIIHEMVHATIFAKDSVTFNENLASFIADMATDRFLKQAYGNRSTQYCSYKLSKAARQQLNNYMLDGISLLDSLYRTFTSQDAVSFKTQKKSSMIRAIVNALDTLSVNREQLPIDRLKTTPLNNAYFMVYRRYRSEKDRLERELNNRYGGSIEEMIRDYKTKFPFL